MIYLFIAQILLIIGYLTIRHYVRVLINRIFSKILNIDATYVFINSISIINKTIHNLIIDIDKSSIRNIIINKVTLNIIDASNYIINLTSPLEIIIDNGKRINLNGNIKIKIAISKKSKKPYLEYLLFENLTTNILDSKINISGKILFHYMDDFTGYLNLKINNYKNFDHEFIPTFYADKTKKILDYLYNSQKNSDNLEIKCEFDKDKTNINKLPISKIKAEALKLLYSEFN